MNDNDAAFRALALNRAVMSHPHLQAIVDVVLESYRQYEIVGGRPDKMAVPGIGDREQNFLRSHYRSPSKNLTYISELREATDHLMCPMCGSLHSGTLDHYLPQQTYAIFSIFSLNLVPACKCNSKRGAIVVGPNPGERVLHPYFDEVLAERLVSGRFTNLGPTPLVTVELAIPETHPEYSALSFHFRQIVCRTSIKRYLANIWVKLCRKPSVVVRAFRRDIQDFEELRHVLEEERNAQDAMHDGKNNWNSVFVSGLLDPPVMQWLAERFSASGRLRDSPLI